MYNLVSSKWADWQHFTLHALPKGFSLPQLSNGMEIKCHGYISGTWTDQDLSYQRRVSKLIVVDAVLSASAATNTSTHLFALSTEALGSSERFRRTYIRYTHVHSSRTYRGSFIVSRLDKRAFCGRLNPSLYVLAHDYDGVFLRASPREMEGGTGECILSKYRRCLLHPTYYNQ